MNNNFDENTMNNIKNMVDSGDINGAISQISPEMIQNFSKMLSQNQSGTNSSSSNYNSGLNNGSSANGYGSSDSSSNGFSNSSSSSSANSSATNNNGFDFSNIDMNAVMKMASNLNNSGRNDPRGNLLNALKPYMRDSKKGKMDNYMNLLNMAKMADLFKNNSNNMPNNGQEKH